MLKQTPTFSIFASLMMLATSGVAYSQGDTKTVPLTPLQPSTPIVKEDTQQLKPLVVDPLLLQGALDNGVRYQIRPTTEPKGRASVRLYVEAGSLDEKEETKGLSHFLEHLVFNGSRNFERGELIPTMQKLGIGFGGDSNAYTSLYQTVYMMDLPNLEESTVDFVMTVMRDFSDGATLSDEAIDKERGIIISELKARDSASYRARLQMLDQVTAGTRIVEYMPIGLPEVILNAPYEAFRTIYRERYTADRVTVMITGDITQEQGMEWVNKYFGDMPATKGAPRIPAGEVDTTPTVSLIPNSEAAMTSLSITMVSPYSEKEDSIEQRVADFPLQLACKMLNNRLSRIAREENAPFASAQAGQEDVLSASSIFTITCNAKPENHAAALTRIEQELRRACRYGFQEAEYQEAIDSLAVAYQSAIDSWPTTNAAAMAKNLIECKDDKLVVTDPSEDMRAFVEGVKFVMSDPTMCQKLLAAEYLPEKAMLCAMGALPEGLTEQALTKIYQASLKQDVKAPAKIEVAKFAYSDVGPAGTIVKKDYLEDIAVTTITLSNGIKVNLKPLDFKKGSISVSADVDGGALRMPAKLGLKNFAGAILTSGGMEAHSHEELQRILAGNKVGLKFSINDDRFTFAGSTNMTDLELQCQVLAAMIMHPGYRDEAERVYRQMIPNIFQRLSTTPDGALSLQGLPKIYGNDVRFTLPSQATLEGCSTEEVKVALAPFLKDGAMEVTLVGDFVVEDVLPILERSLGAMPQRKAEFEPLTDEQRQVTLAPEGWGKRDWLNFDSAVDKTLVVQYTAAGDGMDKKRNRRLTVLASIVREKLFDGLRAALGEAYSPSVKVEDNSTYKDAAFILCLSSGVVDNRVKVSSAMDCILSQIGEGTITQDDFDRAIGPLLSAVDKQLRDPGFWASAVSRIQSDEQYHDLLRGLKADVESITYEEINELAKEIFGSGKSNYLFAMPDSVLDTRQVIKMEEAVPVSDADAKDEAEVKEKAEPKKKLKSTEQAPAAAAAGNCYAVVIAEETYKDPAWQQVAQALLAKYAGTKLCVVPKIEDCAFALHDCEARYAGIIAKPEEIDYKVINAIHRAARKVDDDLWGDCMWGLITGYTADDAMAIVKTTEPLTIKRSLATTNVNPARFEHSFTIPDWAPCEIMSQTGYQDAPKETVTDEKTLEAGMQSLFAKELATQKPDLVTTSAHATEYNLEMPFGEGLIYSYENRFYELKKGEMPNFSKALKPARKGDEQNLAQLAADNQDRMIEPDGHSRVWIAAGNCLFGHPNRSKNSMAVTASSAYGCKQIVGYTVPSWFGDGGWGTIYSFFSSYEGIPLSNAWYLNNQFVLLKSLELNPKTLDAEFNDEEIKKGESIAQSLLLAGIPANEITMPHVGVVHDRDVVAFYGDPKWVAQLDREHAPTGLRIEQLKSSYVFNLIAEADYNGRFAYWYRTRMNVTSCNIEGATVTNDFILIPVLNMKKGEKITITLE